jgi:hypothetical protein
MAKDNNNVVAVELDRTRFLRYGHKALKTMLALTGKAMSEFNLNNFDLNELEKILYCGLLSDAKANGETLKLEDMEDILDEAESFDYLVKKMEEAFSKSFGTGKAKN